VIIKNVFFISLLVCYYLIECLCGTLKLAANVGSYTQGRIAGVFLSSRKTARAERYPPKTTAAELAGS
jgi:hypothetical protein